MNPKKIDKLIIKLVSVSFGLILLLILVAAAQRRGLLPFGFRFYLHGGVEKGQGRIPEVKADWLKPILRKHGTARSVLFASDIYSPAAGRIFLHTNRPQDIRVTVNGTALHLGDQKNFNSFAVKSGFNRLVLRYSLPAVNPWELNVTLTGTAVLVPLPLQRMVCPGGPFSYARVVFHLVRLLDRLQTFGLVLAFLLVLWRILQTWREPQATREEAAFSGYSSIIRFFIVFVSIDLIVTFFVDFFFGKIFLFLPAAIAVPAAAGVQFVERRKKPVTWKLDRQKITMLVWVTSLVLLFAFFTSGTLLPLEPVGYGDLNSHLQMLKSIQLQGKSFTGENLGIYPQGSHALIVAGAKLLGLEPEEFLTPFLMAILIMLLFTIYLLGSSLIPGLPPAVWCLAYAVAYLPFIYQSLLVGYSFPAVLAVALFFASVYCNDRQSPCSAACALAASLIVYPYFVLPFLAGAAVFMFGSASRVDRRLLQRIFLRLLPAVVVTGFYFWIFLRHGFSQQEEGFVTAFLLNPFWGLKPWNALLAFLGIVWLLPEAKEKPARFLLLGIGLGFLANYLPYALFRITSTYYVMKNMIYLIAFGLIFEAAGLSVILRRWFRKKWFAPVILAVSVFLSIAFDRDAVRRLPSSTAHGVTAVNRWIVGHTAGGATIGIATSSAELRTLFQRTLGLRRKVVSVDPAGAALPTGDSWLVADRRYPSADAGLARRRPVYDRGDFSVYAPSRRLP